MVSLLYFYTFFEGNAMGEEGHTDHRALQAPPGPDLFPSSSQTNEFELEISEPILECLWSRCNLSIDCSGARIFLTKDVERSSVEKQ